MEWFLGAAMLILVCGFVVMAWLSRPNSDALSKAVIAQGKTIESLVDRIGKGENEAVSIAVDGMNDALQSVSDRVVTPPNDQLMRMRDEKDDVPVQMRNYPLNDMTPKPTAVSEEFRGGYEVGGGMGAN